MQAGAADALAELAYGDDDMQNAIIKAGGVPVLLALLHAKASQASQEFAAKAICHLCRSLENQDLIVEAGVIPELVTLSKTGSKRAQGYAAAVISNLAKGAVVKGSDGDRLSVIAAAMASRPLSGCFLKDAAGKESAASALHHLSIDDANRDAVAKAGGIPPLVQLLDDTAPQAHAVVVEALARMARDAPSTRRRSPRSSSRCSPMRVMARSGGRRMRSGSLPPTTPAPLYESSMRARSRRSSH